MGKVFWFTGLSGAGKSTVAEQVAENLRGADLNVALIDGDDVRSRLHRHLGFSIEDILENNRLIAGLCLEELPRSDAVLVPIISPLEAGRRDARKRIGDYFRLIYFSAPLAHVSDADVKGLYRRARSGEIDNMIGIADSNPYEIPADADLEIDISRETRADSARRLTNYVRHELND